MHSQKQTALVEYWVTTTQRASPTRCRHWEEARKHRLNENMSIWTSTQTWMNRIKSKWTKPEHEVEAIRNLNNPNLKQSKTWMTQINASNSKPKQPNSNQSKISSTRTQPDLKLVQLEVTQSTNDRTRLTSLNNLQ